MKEFKITFLALSRSMEMGINSNNEIDHVINKLLMAFVREIDYENHRISIDALQQNTEVLREKINLVVQHYKDFEPKFHQINTYFSDLKDGEYFFIFPNTTIPQEEVFQLYNYLFALENNEDFEVITEQMNDLFGELRKSYEVFTFGKNTKNRIGESDKSKRVCRYCGKTMPEVSFKKVAHSISEALGNKRVITNDECDICNEKFGKGFENDIIHYLCLYRIYFGIKGKSGVPKLKGKNFEIENDGSINIKQILSDEEIKDASRDDFKMRLETTQKITAQNIYKALSKYALGVIDSRRIEYFSDTIEWINGTKHIDNLPKVAILMSYELFANHPNLMVYLRKNDDYKLPFAVAEFRFTFLTFVYIIPNSNKDTTDFNHDDNYKYFWDFFKHYSKVQNWGFIKLNDDTPKPFILNLNFEQK